MRNDDVVLYALGDIGVDRNEPESILDLCLPKLREADVKLCQLEEVLSERGCAQVHHPAPFRVHPRNVNALKAAQFDVVSCAGNHCMDYGEEGLLDTIRVLRENGMAPIGVGKDISEARQPAIIESKRTKIAFLSYNSILLPGYWATEYSAGCAPIRVYTFYEQADIGQPGTAPIIHTFVDPDDLTALREDIEKVRPLADVVVVSMHWGIHFTPVVIARYERDVGQFALDCGADIIIGNHAHILKGIEVYKGKVIFHALCDFAFDFPITHPALTRPNVAMKAMRKIHKSWVLDPDYPGYARAPDSRKSIMAKCVISEKRISRVSFLPIYINKYAQPEILPQEDERFGQVVDYMKQITQEAELGTQFQIEGDEVLVLT